MVWVPKDELKTCIYLVEEMKDVETMDKTVFNPFLKVLQPTQTHPAF